MESFVVTGAAGPLAETIVARLAQRPGVTWLTVLASRPFTGGTHPLEEGVRVEVRDLAGSDLDSSFAGVDAVIHLGGLVDDTDPHLLSPGRLVDEARAVLDAAQRGGVAKVVMISSTLVYGALTSNAVPLTESSVLHPEHRYRPAVEFAEIERELGDFRDANPEVTTAVLRSAPLVDDGHAGWLSLEMHRALATPIQGQDPETQCLHASDLADAIGAVISGSLGGVFNVAPDGWLSGAERRALETRPRLRVPAEVATRAASLRALVRGSSAPEGILAYVSHPWVVANDRLRAEGWAPAHSNDEAYVAGFRAAPWSMVSSSRRQELALGAAGVAVTVGVAAVAVAVGRRRRG